MVNEYANNEEMAERRMTICKACPLYKEVAGRVICNPNLYLNMEDGVTVSSVPKIGYKRGCGCHMNSKVRIPSSKCSLGKW